MRESEPTVAITVRLPAATHRALLRLAQQEHRSLAGQAAYLLEQALAVEQRVRRALAAERAEHWAQEARGLGGTPAESPTEADGDATDATERPGR